MPNYEILNFVIKEQKRVVGLLVTSGGVRERGTFSALVRGPHPKLKGYGVRRELLEVLKHQMMKALLEITLKGMNDEQKTSLLGTIANRMETMTNKVTVTEPPMQSKTK